MEEHASRNLLISMTLGLKMKQMLLFMNRGTQHLWWYSGTQSWLLGMSDMQIFRTLIWRQYFKKKEGIGLCFDEKKSDALITNLSFTSYLLVLEFKPSRRKMEVIYVFVRNKNQYCWNKIILTL